MNATRRRRPDRPDPSRSLLHFARPTTHTESGPGAPDRPSDPTCQGNGPHLILVPSSTVLFPLRPPGAAPLAAVAVARNSRSRQENNKKFLDQGRRGGARAISPWRSGSPLARAAGAGDEGGRRRRRREEGGNGAVDVAPADRDRMRLRVPPAQPPRPPLPLRPR
jgi:hypothetical protein